MKKTTLFKQLITASEILVLPGAHDALSAKIVEKAGFKAVTMGGYPASAALLGKPDVNLLTMTEMVNHARNMAEAVDIPLFVDGDTGHGNVTNVIRTVREFEKAGVAGLFIEDQVSPKRCGHMAGKQVIPARDMAAKVRAAVDARSNDDLIIIARTDALAVEGWEGAMARCRLYADAGADVIFVDGQSTMDHVENLPREIDRPCLINMGPLTPQLSIAELKDLGYRLAIFPIVGLAAAIHAVRRALEDFKTTGKPDYQVDVLTEFLNFNTFLKVDYFRELEEKYKQE